MLKRVKRAVSLKRRRHSLFHMEIVERLKKPRKGR